jgi:methylenetetrahydrofolate reductase (NADPH)
MPGVPHFSCVGTTKAMVRSQLDEFRALGIRRMVALRGDLPSGYGGAVGEFRYASDLVAYVREVSGDEFHIEVAAYPEMHPQARSPQADVQAFATKVKAGANGALTQFFYNADAYFRFVDEARRLGVDVPIAPGIMPITNSAQLLRFADANGSDVPRWMRLRLQSYGDDTASIRQFGLDVVSELCVQLQRAGVPSLHFYAMNQAEPVLKICERLGY